MLVHVLMFIVLVVMHDCTRAPHMLSCKCGSTREHLSYVWDKSMLCSIELYV
jgi:hypothetical protein